MTDREERMLVILAEQALEVYRSVGVVFRYGSQNNIPNESQTCIQKLQNEVGNLLALCDVLMDEKVISVDSALMKTKKGELKQVLKFLG